MNLSEIRNLLREEDIMLTKSLGQTFMHDQNQLCKIVGLAKLTAADHVIEIGPGLGSLTGLLLQTAGHVTAIETDRRLVKLLDERFGERSNFTLQHADAIMVLGSNDVRVAHHAASSRDSTLLSSRVVFVPSLPLHFAAHRVISPS